MQLRLLLEKIKVLSLFQRVFQWKRIRTLSYDAYSEYMHTQEEAASLADKLDKTERRLENTMRDNNYFREQVLKSDSRIRQLEEQVNQKKAENDSYVRKIAGYDANKENHSEEHRKGMAELLEMKRSYEANQQRLQEERLKSQQEEFERLKKTWRDHEQNVRNAIETICRNHSIEYVEEIPFAKKPDNLVRIGDECVVFDAKSPMGDNLENFPTYLKQQAEAIRKYASEKSVRKELFLVVPSNTVEFLPQFVFPMGDYKVYVISLDAIEPVILTLRKIEDYEFIDKLSPEERDNIARIIGKFAHATKRRLQIDFFFMHEFFEILGRYESQLPEEILKIVRDYEVQDKLNPPIEKRKDRIDTNDLESEMKRIAAEATAHKIELAGRRKT